VTKKKKESKTTIFIHSLFRTGSTYFWNKFRKRKQYCCYYEPFHQGIISMSMENPAPWSHDRNTTRAMGHPNLEKDYMFEYRELLRQNQVGVPHFDKAFSFDNFCLTGPNQEQKKYIDFLIKNAGEKIPLFQFNRSALRIRWFKKYYPKGLHIYMIRNPHDQFDSYRLMQQEQNLDIFLTMDLIVSGVNVKVSPFDKLAQNVPLFEYHSENFEDEVAVYQRLLPIYSIEDKYFIFYFIWFASLVDNLLNADIIASIDLLSSSETYRQKITLDFNNRQVHDIDFGDAGVRKRAADVIDEEVMTEIQETVQSIVLKLYSPKDIKKMVEALGPEEREYFNFHQTRMEELRETDLPKTESREEYYLKYKQAFEHFSNVLTRQQNHIDEQKNSLIGKQAKILQLQQMLEDYPYDEDRIEAWSEMPKNETADVDPVLKKKEELLNTKESQIDHLKEELVEKEKQLELKEGVLKREGAEIQRLDQQLEDKGNRLIKTEIRLQKEEKQIVQLQRTLELKQEQLVKNEKKLLLDEEQIEQLEQQRKWIKLQLERKDTEIEKNAQLIKQKSLQLEENETMIQQLKQRLEQNEKTLSNKMKRIDELTQKNEQMDEALIKEKESKELILNQLNDERNELGKKVHELEQVNDSLAGNKLELKKKIGQLKHFKKLLAENNQKVAQLESSVAQKNEHIKRIYASKTHRIGRVVIYPFRLVKRIQAKLGRNDKEINDEE